MARIAKKAQDGDKLRKFTDKDYKRKDSVPSEMFPGKMVAKKDVVKGPYIKKTPAKKMKDGGKSFPDLNKDGKVTKADILVGRGVIKAKKGVKVAQDGSAVKVALRTGQLKRLGRLSAKNPEKAEKVGSKMVERATRKQRGKEFIQKNMSNLLPKSKSGSKMGKCRYGCK